MADNALFRARLTGVITQDASDPFNPAGEQAGLVTYIKEDTALDPSDPGAEVGIARVLMPNGAYCPFYAAKLHLFGTLENFSTPLAIDSQPRVIVRRDFVGGGSACQSVVVSPTFVVRVDQKHGGSPTDPITADDFIDLTFFDATNSVAGSKLGVLAGVGVGSSLTITPGDLAIVTMRTSDTLTALPAGYTYTWVCAPLGAGGNVTIAQIVAGTGQSYLMDIFGDGPSNPATDTNVAVLQLQINPAATLPIGSWALIVNLGGNWYMQTAVWLS